MDGMIFDFQRFALHDGPGIRSVVFLKGCPLQCKWCCNPESQKPGKELALSKDKCQDCFQCVTACSSKVHRAVLDQHIVDFENCTYCGECVDVCSAQALKIYGYRMSSDDVLERLMRDKDYYQKSGGGITLSGGEPLYQFDFALDILKKSKAAGLHISIETTGYIQQKRMEEILPLVDLFLYDYKITDDKTHQFYTGVSNQSIIQNLHFILQKKAKVHLRCIIIPGINDNQEHFQAIAGLSNKYPNLEKIELMPYHEYGKHKYADLNQPYFDLGTETVSKKYAESWLHKLEKLGCENVLLG